MKKILILVIILFYTEAGFATDHDAIDIHGFITQGYLKTDHNDFIAETEDGSFEFNEMGLNFNKRLSDGLDFSLQFFAYDFGGLGNDRIAINHAGVSYYVNQQFTFRAGKSKVSYGLYGDSRDMDMLRTFVLLPQGVYTEAFRDSIHSAKGFEIYGSGYPEPLKFMEPLGEFYYKIQYGIMDIPKDSGVSHVLAMTLHTDPEESTSDTSYNLVLGWETPVPGLRLQGQYSEYGVFLSGKTFDDEFWDEIKIQAIDQLYPDLSQDLKNAISSAVIIGDMPVSYSGDVSMYIIGAEFTWRGLTLAAEQVFFNMKYKTRIKYKAAGEDSVFDYTFENPTLGYYYMGSYQISDWLKIGGYYTVYYPDKDNKKGGGGTNLGNPDYFAWQKDSCIAARFDLSPNSIFKIEGHYIDGGAQLDYVKPLDDYSKTHRYWYLFAAKLSYNF